MMYVRKAVLFAFALVGVCAGSTSALTEEHASGPLTFDRTSGSAPLTVSLTGPPELVERWTGWQRRKSVHSMWGDGFWINWGDGTGDGDSRSNNAPPDPVAEPGHHIFSKPGTYSVAAGLYQFMPDDAHRIYWRGEAKVTVEPKK